MILLLHVAIAITSLALTTYAFFVPSRAKLNASYVFIALTLVSGTLLVFSAPAHILQACTSGMIYFVIASAGALAVRRKLA